MRFLSIEVVQLILTCSASEGVTQSSRAKYMPSIMPIGGSFVAAGVDVQKHNDIPEIALSDKSGSPLQVRMARDCPDLPCLD